MAEKKIIGKHMMWGAGAVVLTGGVLYLSRLNRMKANVELVTSVMFHKVNLSGITLRIDVLLKNPTDGTIMVKFPFVKIQSKGNTIASSDVVDKDFSIPKFGQIKLDPIYITLNFLKLATSAPGLLKDYRTSGILSFDMETVTTLNNSIPFNKKSQIKL